MKTRYLLFKTRLLKFYKCEVKEFNNILGFKQTRA